MLSDSFHHHHHPLQIQPDLSLDEPPPPPRVLTILSYVLEKLVARNDQLIIVLSEQQQKKWMNSNGTGDDDQEEDYSNNIVNVVSGKNLKGFDGVRAPSISVPKYLERIYKYTNCSPACFVVGYVYLDRLIHKFPDSLVVSLNVHRLLLTCVMVASKMLDDVHYNNAFFARVGGITNSELNRLELELLFLLDFGLVVSSQVFETYCQHLEKEMLRNGTAILECYAINNPPAAIASSCADASEISVEDHALISSSTHDHQTLID